MKQLKLNIPAELKRRPQLLERNLIKQCPDGVSAIRLAVQISGHKNEFVADLLNIDRAQFSRIMNGRHHFPANQYGNLMWLSGSAAPAQFFAYQAGYDLKEWILSVEEENELLKQQLKDLKNGSTAITHNTQEQGHSSHQATFWEGSEGRG